MVEPSGMTVGVVDEHPQLGTAGTESNCQAAALERTGHYDTEASIEAGGLLQA